MIVASTEIGYNGPSKYKSWKVLETVLSTWAENNYDETTKGLLLSQAWDKENIDGNRTCMYELQDTGQAL